MDVDMNTNSTEEEAHAYQCLTRAGYLSGTQQYSAIFIALLSLIFTAAFTLSLRVMAQETLSAFVPKSPKQASESVPAAEHTNSAAAETPEASARLSTYAASPPVHSHVSGPDPPPPYNAENTSSTEASSQTDPPGMLSGDPSTKNARWRAQSFAISTLCLALLIISLTTLGFALQNLWYCPRIRDSEDTVTFWMGFVWFWYAVLVVFASSGLMGWIVKFLALWGPHTELGRGRPFGEPIDLDLAVFILSGFGYAVVEMILACQKFWCPGALEEYDEVGPIDVELGEAPRDCSNGAGVVTGT